jgi:hypothetical protein
MSLILNEYDNILLKKYYKSLKKSLNKNNILIYNQNLDDILSEENTETENLSISCSDNQNIDEYYYKKNWNKLNIVHKKIKIKEFINNLTIPKNKKLNLNNNLILLLNDKKFNKNNDMEYDSVNGKIISIPVLKCKNDNYYI